MERRRSSRRSSQPAKKVKRSNSINILVFKSIDPVIQSLLIIFFLYCLDVETEYSHQTVLLYIVGWQIASAIINFFISDPKQLKTERLVCLVVLVVYMPCYYFFLTHVTEKFIAINKVETPTLPLYEIIITAFVLLIAFWYNVICYREIKSMLKGVNNEMTL
jgi:hypothetical protein